jgi:uncharacterized protein (DUF2336 family)
MIVRHFLHWMNAAPAAERGDASAALARAYLYSDMSADDRAAAEGALIMLLDDPSPVVQGELARALAFSDEAPPAVILGLAGDQPEIASWVLEHSPLLLDTDLVELIAAGAATAQLAIAKRTSLPCAASAALAEVGSAEACLVLLENPQSEIVMLSFQRIAERFGHLGAIREAMLLREDLPAAVRQALVANLSETLARFVSGRAWLEHDRAQRIAREACEKATVTLAADSPERELAPLVRHLRESGQLTAGLVLRALLSGHVEMFLAALAELCALPIRRVSSVVYDEESSGFRALFEKAGFPHASYPAFRAALEAMREGGFDMGDGIRLKRRIVERVLTRCAEEGNGVDVRPLLTLLRRFAAEAAREEARVFCQELAGEAPEEHLLAA